MNEDIFDSLQLFEMTLDLIKEIIRLSQNIASGLRRLDGGESHSKEERHHVCSCSFPLSFFLIIGFSHFFSLNFLWIFVDFYLFLIFIFPKI